MSVNKKHLPPTSAAKANDNPFAWDLFKRSMRGRSYGREELNEAWLWFYSGWLAYQEIST